MTDFGFAPSMWASLQHVGHRTVRAELVKRRLPVVEPSPLPPRHAAWMDRVLGGPIPPETEATCSDCAMCAPTPDGAADERFFDPRTKCCTYVPPLANFLVGGILADDDPASAPGRATVEARLRGGVAVTPLGLESPPTFALLYNASAARSFGHSRSLRCPHYLEDAGGRCGVWRHRPAICATWFCKYVRGATGMRFWQAAYRLLSSVERALARWCVLELDIGSEALARLFPLPAPAAPAAVHTLDDVPDREARRAVWGRWVGREAEFYRECDRRVRSLDWNDVVAIGGQDVRIAIQLVEAAYSPLIDDAIPEALQVGRLEVERLSPRSCRVSGYSAADALELPRTLLDVLGHFDGRPTAEALAAIEGVARVRIDPALVRRLVDFEILVPKGTSARRR